MKCPHCGQEHPDNTKFCPETAAPLPRRYLSQEHTDTTKFCPETGQAISLPKSCQNKECKNFGKYNLQSDARFCPECGCPVEDKKPLKLWKWILFSSVALMAIIATVILVVRVCDRKDDPVMPSEDVCPIEEKGEVSKETEIYCDYENEECYVNMPSGIRLFFPKEIADEFVTEPGKMTIFNNNNSIRLETSCDTQYETLSDAFDYWRSVAETYDMTYKRNAESFVVVSWWNGDIGNYYRAEMHNGILHEWHMIWNRKDHDVAKPILDGFKVKFGN